MGGSTDARYHALVIRRFYVHNFRCLENFELLLAGQSSATAAKEPMPPGVTICSATTQVKSPACANPFAPSCSRPPELSAQ